MALNFTGLFPPGREPLINVDWTTFADNTGFILFDCYTTDEVTQSFNLIRGVEADTLTSSLGATGKTSAAFSGNTDEIVLDLDFDLSAFNRPQTVKGTAILKVGVFNNSTTNGDLIFIIAKLRKFDGSTETEIGSVQSRDVSITSSATVEEGLNLTMSLTTTSFKVGDILRLTIEGWGENMSGNTMTISFNPRDTAVGSFTAGNTRLPIAVPFKIET